jgi:queuine tRNA-ribosyltransferase
MLGPILLSSHNLTYYQGLVRDARIAIESDGFVDFFRERIEGWQAGGSCDSAPQG